MSLLAELAVTLKDSSRDELLEVIERLMRERDEARLRLVPPGDWEVCPLCGHDPGDGMGDER